MGDTLGRLISICRAGKAWSHNRLVMRSQCDLVFSSKAGEITNTGSIDPTCEAHFIDEKTESPRVKQLRCLGHTGCKT